MKKQLVFRIEVACDPNGANPTGMVEALKPFGEATIVSSAMRRLETDEEKKKRAEDKARKAAEKATAAGAAAH